MIVSKYNASGNDFVVFSSFLDNDRSALAKNLCDRFNGVGADGLIVILPANDEKCDIRWEFYNSDGSVASMCGNGSRAAALYAYFQGLANENMRIKTGAGIIKAKIFKNENLCQNASEILNKSQNEISGQNPSQINKSMLVEVELTSPKKLNESFNENGKTWYFYDTGVPHLITFSKNLAEFDLDLAKKMRQKHNANVNFALIKDSQNIAVRTYERGVENETMACGTGMAASFLAGFELGLVKAEICVQPKSNEKLFLRFEEGKIYFKGEVKKCFDAVL